MFRRNVFRFYLFVIIWLVSVVDCVFTDSGMWIVQRIMGCAIRTALIDYEKNDRISHFLFPISMFIVMMASKLRNGSAIHGSTKDSRGTHLSHTVHFFQFVENCIKWVASSVLSNCHRHIATQWSLECHEFDVCYTCLGHCWRVRIFLFLYDMNHFNLSFHH